MLYCGEVLMSLKCLNEKWCCFPISEQKDITVLDHVTYFARPPCILLYLMLRQFFIRVWFILYSTH